MAKPVCSECLFHIIRVKRIAKCYMLYWGKKNPWTLVKQTKNPKPKFSLVLSTWVHMEQHPTNLKCHSLTETCLSVLQLARRPGWWPPSSVSLLHVQPHSRLSKYGFGGSSSRAVCRSSKVLYWLNLPRPKSENNFKGSRSHFNFKKQLTIKKNQKTKKTLQA